MERPGEIFKAIKRHPLRLALFATVFLAPFIPDTIPTYALASRCQGPNKRMVTATWYDLSGFPTFSGEIMNRNASTGAVPRSEKRLLGHKLRVKYNGIKVKVRINDLGEMGEPPYQDYFLDVTPSVAEKQGWIDKGNVQVCIEELPDKKTKTKLTLIQGNLEASLPGSDVSTFAQPWLQSA